MKTSLKALWYVWLVVLLAACGGYEDDGAPPELLGNNDGATSLFVAVEANTPSTRSARRALLSRERISDLTRDAFRPVALVPDSTVSGGFREVDIGIFEFENRGDGVYRVAIDGEPRVNVIIFATVNGVTFKYLVLEPGSESEPLVIDVETTAATELYLEAVEEQGDFSDIDAEKAEDLYKQILDIMESSEPPPEGVDSVDYYKEQVEDTCSVDVVSGSSDCPRKVRGSVAGLNAGELRLELNSDEEIQITQAGAFEFEALLPIASEFDVEVSRQPSGLQCVITSGGAGVIGNDDSYSVVVTCSASGTFSVGATVSGLIGSLELALNGEEQTVDGNGVFSFDQQLTTGAAYSVTIEEQPEGQVCSLQNASGVIGNAAVTNIAVTCVGNLYTVGGSISGLLGSVSLQLNGGSTQTVSSAGTSTFVFDTSLAFGSAYSVTVSAQPVNQVCSVNPGSGIMGPGNVTNILVSCSTTGFTVTTTAENGSITSGLNPLVSNGASTTVTGSANPGFYFTGVSGCGGATQTNSNNDQSVTTFSYPTGAITQACSVAATFALKSYAVSTTAQDGQVTVSPNPVAHGSQATVSLVASPGYYFSDLVGCGLNESNTDQAVTSRSFSTPAITAQCGIDALFLRRTVQVAASAGLGGQVTSASPQLVNVGTSATVSFQADEGYYISSIAGCGGSPYSNSSPGVTVRDYQTGNVESDCAVEATFALKTYAITTSISNGTISPSTAPVIVNHGATQAFTLTAASGYFIESVSSTCGGTLPPDDGDESRTSVSYTTAAITSECQVSVATAERTPRTIGGKISGFGFRVPTTVDSLILALKDAPQGSTLGTLTVDEDLPAGSPFPFVDAQNDPVNRYSGETYSVEVVTQPTGLVCDVMQPSGTVSAGNVTSVEVFCQTYSSYLQGVWYRRDTGGALSLFRYRAEHAYVMASAVPGEPAATGVESGFLYLDDMTGNVEDVGAQTDDLNGGISDPGFVKNVSFREGKLVISTAPESDPSNVTEQEWSRVEKDPQGLGGAWTGIEGRDSQFLIALFPTEGQYMMVEPVKASSAPNCETEGLEYGAFSFDAQARRITLSNNLVDTNGCGGAYDPATSQHQTLDDVYLVDLDADPSVLDGWRLAPSGGSADMLLREGYLPQDFAQLTSAMTGTWTSFLSRTPDVVYLPDAREVYRFDALESATLRISYINGYVDVSHSGIEAGRVEYDSNSGALRVFTGLDTNGEFGGFSDEANVGMGGSPLPGTNFAPRVFVFIEYINNLPTILHTYDYVTNDTRLYIRGPQRESGELVGTWVEGNVSFFSPTLMFFEDNTFFLLDPEGINGANCSKSPSQPGPGIEFGTWSYTPPTLGVSLSLPAAVADTNGCGGLWNPDLQTSNVAADPVLVDGGSNPDDVSDDLLDIGDVNLFRVPNTSTVPLQSSYVVGGFASLNGVNATASLRDANGNTLDTLMLTGLNFFEFPTRLPDGSVWQVDVSTSDPGKQCTASPASGVIAGNDATTEVVCSEQAFSLGGSVLGLRTGETLVLSVQRSPVPFQSPQTLTLDGTGSPEPFTFPGVQFQPGDGFVVDVVNAPLNRFCRLTNGTGTFSGSDVNGVDVQCLDNQIQIGAIVPTTPVIGREVSISGFGFTTGSRFFVGNVEIDSGTTGFQATARQVRFIMPNVGAGSHAFRASAFSGATEIGRDIRQVNIANAFTVDALSRFSRVAIGGFHTCAIAPPQSEVSCWGRNLFGEAGISPDVNSGGRLTIDVPQQIGLTDVQDVVAGDYHTCARMNDLTVRCWGANSSGQLGNLTQTDSFQPQLVRLENGDPLINVQQISAGANTTCAKVAGGNVYCWGSNASGVINGELQAPVGGGALLVVNHAILAYSQNNAVSVAVGTTHSCVLRSGEVACWGTGVNGQLGALAVGSSASAGTILPSNPVVTPDASFVAVSELNTCIITGGQQAGVKCWGSNGNGQLLLTNTGAGNPVNQSEVPVAILGMESRVSKLAVAENFICATQSVDPQPPEINPLSVVRCWGGNERGQLGDGRFGQPFVSYQTGVSLPTTVLDITNASEIYAGGILDGSEPGLRACAVTGQGSVRCWGAEYENGRGDGDSNTGFYRDAVTLPLSLVQSVPTGGRSIFSALAPSAPDGSAVTCARNNAGEVRCVGGKNQIGGDTLEGSSVFSLVADIPPAIDVAVGDAHVCSTSSSAGAVTCWGDGIAFDAFAGLQAARISIPTIATPTNGLNRVLSAGSGHTCARTLTPDAGIYCWGRNNFGQTGINAGPSSLAPNKVPGLVTPRDLDAGGDVTCARDIGDNDKIKCWGNNTFLQLGSSGPESAVPVTVKTDDQNVDLTGAQDISVGYSHACSVVSNNKVRCWGRNLDGQAGLQPSQVVEGASEVVGIPDVLTVAAGDRMTCGITAVQRRVVCWGWEPVSNQSGIVRFIPGISGAMSLSVGESVGCARLNDSTAQCWGLNRMGELGLPYKPSIVRLPVPGIP